MLVGGPVAINARWDFYVNLDWGNNDDHNKLPSDVDVLGARHCSNIHKDFGEAGTSVMLIRTCT